MLSDQNLKAVLLDDNLNKKVISNLPRHHCWRHRRMVDCRVVPQGRRRLFKTEPSKMAV